MSRTEMKPSDYIRKGWTQGRMARDAAGIGCDPKSPLACYWCIVGALVVSQVTLDPQTWSGLSKEVQRLPVWNDDPKRTQQEVIDLLESVGL